MFDALRTFDDTDVTEISRPVPRRGGAGTGGEQPAEKAAGFHGGRRAAGHWLYRPYRRGSKTSALRALERLGGLVLDCDAIYHEQLRTDAALRRPSLTPSGPVFAPDGSLDRQRLGGVVFGDPASLARLNDIIFTYLPRELRRRMDESAATVVGIDAINLVESGLCRLCRRTVAVIAPAEERVRASWHGTTSRRLRTAAGAGTEAGRFLP